MKQYVTETPSYEVDLTSCDREPIHRLGAVQSFGFLIAVSTDWIVSRVSDNVSEFLDVTPDAILGQPLGTVMSREALHAIRGLTQGLRGDDAVERAFGVTFVANGVPYDVAMYLSGQSIVIEAEPSEHEATTPMALVRSMTARLQSSAGVDKLLREAARQVRALTGFDRVMVYRFDQDGSGTVSAEAVSSSLEPYLGLRYPASDIPKQARALYERNMLRLIWDTTQFGSAIEPRVSPDGEPIDLSMSVLRSVSPIHLEYLTNMGVRASMSISIIVEGKLWGLFACHHMEPRRISLERRTATELFGQTFSYLLDTRLRDEGSAYEERSRALHNRLMSAVAAEGSTMDAVLGHLDELSEIISCDGLGVWIDGKIELHGSTPTPDEFNTLVKRLNLAPAGQAFATHELATTHPPASDFAERACGALAIPISRQPRDYLVFFRRELARTVRWAGDPSKPAVKGPNGIRLTPRKSFEAWQEVVRGQSTPWTDTDLRIAEAFRVTLLEVILRMTDASDRERRSLQDRQELLIAELNHRVRNILGLIRGLVAQTSAGAASVEDFASVVGGRIQALARAHDQVTINNWGPGSLTELLRSEVNAYMDETDRIRIHGEEVLLEPQAFSTVALVMHELMTNAAKYGSLTDRSGRVDVTWQRDTMDRLVIEWHETGGPAVQAPERKGFGTTIIERSIPFELKGEASIHFDLTGVQAHFVVPAAYVVDAPTTTELAASTATALTAATVGLSGPALVVEDNMLIALDAEDILAELGASRVETAASAREALRLIEKQEPTFALLDVNLGQETSIPVAEELARRHVPFVFATGYGAELSLPPAIENTPVLAKPYTLEMVRKTLASMS